MFPLFAVPPNLVNTPSSSPGLYPLLDPYANLVADQRSGVLRRGHTAAATTVIEVLAGETESSPSPGMSPSRGGIEEIPDRTLASPSTTTLGAITLLAFLNLLGYIQNVLTGTSGRKRRSATWPAANGATLSEQGSSALEERVPSRASVGFQAPFTALLQDFVEYIRRGEAEEDTNRQDSLFLPWPQSSRRRIAPPHISRPGIYRQASPPRGITPRPLMRTTQTTRGGLGSYLSSMPHRLKLAASIMGFLNNPSPERVRRDLEQAVSRPGRHKRFSTAMNAWYDDLAGQNYDGTRHASPGEGGSLLNRLMIGLGRRILGV